ncbi:ubiquitin carboxyl-terminal hydrolase 12-like [Momordica charantia]|uniref:Ubiquitin carboxyl-terminal hydrolase 12-like n=1 Tax=Momordica charantia TaxID=3673 RepID=A0A6J1CXZ0_MOMCH|nr:ubiquitin carboxyl-terminal hydrolase 12-like [Momordica charantia]
MERMNIIFHSLSSEADTDSGCVVIRSTRDEKPLHYTLQIQSFSLLKTALVRSDCDRYESRIFNAGGYKWKLAMYPTGDVKRNGSHDHISLYLVKAEDDIPTSEVNVVFTFLVYDSLKDKYLAVQDGIVRRFHAIKTEWGFEKLISLDTFNDSSNGFLVDDCCAFGVDVVVMKLEGYRWKLWLYPKGCSNAETGFLSLYLILDSSKEILQGSKVYVEYELALLSQLGAEPEKETYNYWFAGGGPNFISLSELKKPLKGYLHNDTLKVEVKINVISTSKSFNSSRENAAA